MIKSCDYNIIIAFFSNASFIEYIFDPLILYSILFIKQLKKFLIYK